MGKTWGREKLSFANILEMKEERTNDGNIPKDGWKGLSLEEESGMPTHLDFYNRSWTVLSPPPLPADN